MSEPATRAQPPEDLLGRLLAAADRSARVTHVERIAAREGRRAPWPAWLPDLVKGRLTHAGIPEPWAHQAAAADLAHDGRSVIIATGTASGKSLAYLMPGITGVLDGDHVLYLAPTKALAADQLRAIRDLKLAQVRAATLDGDTPRDERDWIRRHANVVLTNPDMLHHNLLPQHARWTPFLRRLRYVVIDECHRYRGVFGSHVAQIVRRLRRLCAKYGSDPVFVLASATASDPGATAHRLTGVDVAEVVDDASPRGATAFALWEPPLTDLRGERGAPVRRTATAETADLLADLVIERVRTLTFVRSRRGAESVALSARRALAEAGADELTERIAAYRAGYLAEDRRTLEAALNSGELLGVASTNALELGVDVTGLDAVLITGWPGTRASLWQQAGRAGRAGQDALAVLVARDDPLDTYLVHHPDALFGRPVEATVLDPDNPYVVSPHLCAAASELPLTDADVELFGPSAPDLLPDLVRRGMLRHRPTGWYWTKRQRATDLADIRGAGGSPVHVVERGTGELLGTVDEPSAHTMVHRGAVYLHQGDTFVVADLDLETKTALVDRADPDYSTFAREVTDIAIVETLRTTEWEHARLCFGTVDVTSQVVSYLMRRPQTGEVIGEEQLELPARTLRTRAVWWTVPDEELEPLIAEDLDLPGSAHAAEHAAIGLLPLFATCDRWDIGGVSTKLHPDTGRLTVFVHDGSEGGAGFAERGYTGAARWLRATHEAIAACECEAGCPSCIQSPKCGNGNDPLDKRGALALLEIVLKGAATD